MIDTTQQRITLLEKKIGPDAKSPLFAQLAYYYLEVKRAQDALRVCDAGLANFPFYTTGHLIKGKALVMLNMRAEARREFEFVLDFLPSNTTVTTLLSELPPGEDESIVTTERPQRKEVQPEVAAPTQYDYVEPKPAQPALSPEPSYGFAETEQITQEPQLEPPLATPASGSNFFDAITQGVTPEVTDTAFGTGFEAPAFGTPAETDQSAFSGFTFPTSEPSPAAAFSPSIEQPSGFDFSMPTAGEPFQAPTMQPEGESYEEFSNRRRGELYGENTLSLDDYLGSVSTAPSTGIVDIQLPTSEPAPIIEMPSESPNRIEELATKLQGAGKITPVINFAQKETSTASEQDTPASMGFVTPTLAEIYAKQGWYDDAIKAYKTLARNKPAEKEKYEKRITELEALKGQSSS
jgi:tetratricopeptide (TPR) repeat protein